MTQLGVLIAEQDIKRAARNAVLEEAALAVEQLGENAADAFNNRHDQTASASVATGTAINFYNRAARTVRGLKS